MQGHKERCRGCQSQAVHTQHMHASSTCITENTKQLEAWGFANRVIVGIVGEKTTRCHQWECHGVIKLKLGVRLEARFCLG